jgi:cell division protein FtsA
MRRGVIDNPEKVSQNVSDLLDKIQEETGKRIEKVAVNIGGSHIFLTSSTGSVAISRVDHSISQEDVERSVQAARAFSLPANTEIIDFFEKRHVVDGGQGVKDPVGMSGIKLESEVVSIGAFSPYYKNLGEVCTDADIFQAPNIVCNPVASSEACLSAQQKELGVVLLDIGAGTTDLAIYKEGDLCHLKVIPVGSEYITEDIAVALRTDINVAEKIKKEFGHCLKSRSGKSLKKKEKEEKEIPPNCLNFSSQTLTKVIKARMSDIFEAVQKEIKKSSVGDLPGGVVITGGGSKIPGIVDLAKKELKLPCKIGVPILKRDGFGEEFEGEMEEDPCFSTAWGLLMASFNNFQEEKKEGVFDKIKKVLKVFVP